MCPVAPSLTFYCSHVVICPFPSLTNEADQPGQEVSVDLEEDYCCGPLIMQRKAGVSLLSDNRRRHLFTLPCPITDFLWSVLMAELDKVMNRGSLVAHRQFIFTL